MTHKLSSTPIATIEQFKWALLALRDKNLASTHLDMLRAQCRAPDSTITATQLAESAGYKNYNAANLQYGTLAFNVASHLGFAPEQRQDGTPKWWTTLSYAADTSDDAESAHFRFVMRPELVAALSEMRWA
jgi:hypothetical protein